MNGSELRQNHKNIILETFWAFRDLFIKTGSISFLPLERLTWKIKLGKYFQDFSL